MVVCLPLEHLCDGYGGNTPLSLLLETSNSRELVSLGLEGHRQEAMSPERRGAGVQQNPSRVGAHPAGAGNREEGEREEVPQPLTHPALHSSTGASIGRATQTLRAKGSGKCSPVSTVPGQDYSGSEGKPLRNP